METRFLKRLLLLCFLVLMLFGASRAFAAGTGERRLGLGVGIPNAVVVFRPSPFEFKGGYDFTEGEEYVFLSGDYLLIDARPVAPPLRFSLGLGAYGKLLLGDSDGDGDEDSDLEGGVRLPVGFSVRTRNEFAEVFVQLSPGLDFYPKLTFSEQPLQVWAGFTLQLD
ncbi:MAG: hypothetical protein ACOCW6_04560 [Spirochaetota bacterium]